ncbi:MAG: Maf family protein [Woeseiaceae bacterium]
MDQFVLHLASASPRRREILNSLDVRHSFAGVNIDETARSGEKARDLVSRLAHEKACAVGKNEYLGLPILAADTVVVVDEQIFGKPASKEHGLAMLAALSGRAHRVLTAVTLRYAGEYDARLSETEVRFRELHPDEAHAYWQSGEPNGKAGAYAIQGLGGVFVESINGSYSGVVGLPVFETAALLRPAGIHVLPEPLTS